MTHLFFPLDPLSFLRGRLSVGKLAGGRESKARVESPSRKTHPRDQTFSLLCSGVMGTCSVLMGEVDPRKAFAARTNYWWHHRTTQQQQQQQRESWYDPAVQQRRRLERDCDQVIVVFVLLLSSVQSLGGVGRMQDTAELVVLTGNRAFRYVTIDGTYRCELFTPRTRTPRGPAETGDVFGRSPKTHLTDRSAPHHATRERGKGRPYLVVRLRGDEQGRQGIAAYR